MSLDLFVKLKYESSTIILFVGIRYSMSDLLYDLNNYAWPANGRYASDAVNDVSAASARLSKLWILCLNDILDWDLCTNLLFPYFLFLFWFSNVILSDAFILPVSQLQTQQVMT